MGGSADYFEITGPAQQAQTGALASATANGSRRVGRREPPETRQSCKGTQAPPSEESHFAPGVRGRKKGPGRLVLVGGGGDRDLRSRCHKA